MDARHLLFAGFFFLSPVIAGSQQAHGSVLHEYAEKRFHTLMDEYFNEMLTHPEFATYAGFSKEWNGQWTEHTVEHYQTRQDWTRDFRKKLKKIDPKNLSEEDQINYHLLARNCSFATEGFGYEMYYMPVDHLGGIPQDVELVLQSMPRDNVSDYENILTRLEKLPELVDQTIVLMDGGVARELTQPRIVMGSLPAKIAAMTPEPLTESFFYAPFTSFPDTIPEADREAIQARALHLIQERVYPAYGKFHDYLITTYLPACRETIGASALPNGHAWYQYCVASHTTTTMTPEEIHQIGLAEVARIKEEMKAIAAECGYDGDLKGFFNYLNTSPEFFYTDAESLLNGYREITSYIDGQLPLLFGRMPKLPYEVVPIPSHAEGGQIGAYYMRGSLQSGRPGRFFVNTHDLSRRPKWQMESLALHEAVPGHHFQISISQEIEGLPDFRRYSHYTAYIEGWGLYSERLGLELGLYTTPYTRFGRLIEEIWRASRLVIDTGIHALGWEREQAIDFFVENTGMSRDEAMTEVDRYIVWPGQALAYKVGELSIRRWRAEAQEALGDAFDIRAFHDALLAKGALPLDICEQQMRQWVLTMKEGAEEPAKCSDVVDTSDFSTRVH